MQETEYYSDGHKGVQREFFQTPSQASLDAAMNERLRELQAEGHTLVRRKKVGRNAPCPCGSGHKLKKCCLPK